jgi:hypothetical protein
VTVGEGTPPLIGRSRLTLWAAGRVTVVVLFGVTGTDWLRTATAAKRASEIASGYAAGIILLAIAVAASVSGAFRFIRVRHVARDPAARTIRPLAVMGRRVRVERGAGVPDLEWKVLITRRSLAGPVTIHGSLEPGSWLVVRLSDDRLIWPATRAQPVIGTGMPAIPQIADLDVARTHRRLLGAYAQVISMVNGLPLLVRVPLAKRESSWWWIAAPRPLIAGLVAAHVRKRLRALGDAHIRAAAQADGDAARRLLREAGQECQELAGTLHRRTWPALLASVITFSVPVYLAVSPKHLPKIPLDQFEQDGLWAGGVALLFFASAPLVMLFRSVLCQRALFRPGQRALLSGPSASARPLTPNESHGWDIYRFERETFLLAGACEPRQWQEHPLIPWLVVALYALGVAIPFTMRLGHVFLGLYILVVLFACSRVFFSILFYAVRDSTSRLRKEQREQ